MTDLTDEDLLALRRWAEAHNRPALAALAEVAIWLGPGAPARVECAKEWAVRKGAGR